MNLGHCEVLGLQVFADPLKHPKKGNSKKEPITTLGKLVIIRSFYSLDPLRGSGLSLRWRSHNMFSLAGTT